MARQNAGEIRKAKLVSADLAGARIGGSDFYLVDLRGAPYSAAQKEHLAATGAIVYYPYP